VEGLIKRKVSCLILDEQKENQYLKQYPEAFVLWKSDNEKVLTENLRKSKN